jgi:hypothetical protein
MAFAYEFFRDQGSIIAGVLALIAGILAYRAGCVQATETRQAAITQVAAAHEQTKAAERQTAVTREIERRRIAREGYAFHAMLEAAMGAVIEDVQAARKLPSPNPTDTAAYSVQAYAVRRRVKQAGFNELRNAFLRFGGTETSQFLQLDKDIEDFAGQCVPGPSRVVGGWGPGVTPTTVGANAGLEEQLDRIEQRALALRDHGAGGMKLCRDELSKDLISLEQRPG